jgi:hypothetical protein
MNTKLTLTIERDIIEKAKKYASGKGRSLSDIVENYLKLIARDEPLKEPEISPGIKSLQGSFKAPKDFDYKKQLSRKLAEKYL